MKSVVLLQFGASWCQPCKAMTPVAEEVARTNLIIHVKVDIEKQPDLANHYNVRGVPMFVLLVDGEEVARQQGAGAESLRKMVKQGLAV
jgi:thioredoxin 1